MSVPSIALRRPLDIREFLEALDTHADLRRIDELVDPELEVGAIIRRSYERRTAAPLLSRIRDAPGFSILGAPGGLSSLPGAPLARIALALGLPAVTTAQDIVADLVAAYARPPIPPVLVPDAPCKRNRMIGSEVDLGRLPQPLLHDGDGGRYFNTWGTIAVGTPDGRWTNWSIARLMTIDRNRLTGPVIPVQHLGMIYREWADLGRPMPFALCQGGDPAVPLVSGSPLPAEVDESGFVGAFLGAPIDVVGCESVDLTVPAGAEIVLEGHVSVTDTAPEGPMGEYSGYLAGGARPQPVYEVEAITFRDDPILPVAVAGEPVDETHTVGALGFAAEAMRLLHAADLPVTFAWVPYASAAHWLVVTVPPAWPDLTGLSAPQFVQRIAEVLFHARIGTVIPKVFVLDDDVDPADERELTWSLATRVHPRDGHALFAAEPVMPLVSCYTAAERARFQGPKIAYNGLLPLGSERPRRTGFAHNYPASVRKAVRALDRP